MTERTGFRLRAGFVDLPDGSSHATITESTSGTIACGSTWCDGSCGLPALVLQHNGVEFKARGQAVAVGAVFQPWPRRDMWTGAKAQVTLGSMTVEQALGLMWW
jgi:hypothetical protein